MFNKGLQKLKYICKTIKMKTNQLTTLSLIFFLFAAFNVNAQAKKEKEEKNTLVITHDFDGKEKTYTLDFSDLEKSLSKLGNNLEKLGDEMEAYFEDFEETTIEVIEIEENDDEFKITITEKQNGKESTKTMYGEEAKKYLTEKEEEKKKLNWMNVEGDITLDVNDDEGESIHIELNMNDLFEDFGIEFSENKKEDKKIIIIKTPNKED